MGTGVLIIGESGSGKSTSLRNFKTNEVTVLNVASKPLPFRGKLDTVNNAGYQAIHETLVDNKKKAYVIDDAGYLLSFHNFKVAKQQGYGKFVDMAVAFEQMLERIKSTDDDTIVYVMMHPEYDINGRMKPKLIGKMLDEKLCVEGLFSIVLSADCDEGNYIFRTKNAGDGVVKAPIGMFKHDAIENDLKAVDTTIRDYYNMAALGGGKNGK